MEGILYMESKTRKILAIGLSAIVVVSVIIIVILLLPPLTPPPEGGTQTNVWTWTSGNYSCNNNGTYSPKGVASTGNVPGSRYRSMSWTDSDGNFWLFGGYGYDNISGLGDYLNDLWKFTISDSTWTWVSGNYSSNNNGTYGTKGVPSTNNVPGARSGSVTWKDTSGNFWLFGGYGYDNVSGSGGRLNDLWKFTISDSTWTWMSGNYSSNNNGTYGTKGVASATNIPGARYGSVFWTDASTKLWLFGGYGYDNISGSTGYLNDLWKYSP